MISYRELGVYKIIERAGGAETMWTIDFEVKLS